MNQSSEAQEVYNRAVGAFNKKIDANSYPEKTDLMNELTEGIGVLGQLRKYQEELKEIEQILGKAFKNFLNKMKAKTLQELEELKKPFLKEIAKIDAKINLAKKKLQSKCKHENARVKYHSRATLGSFWDGSETVFDIICEECKLDQFVKAGSPLWELCYIKANIR